LREFVETNHSPSNESIGNRSPSPRVSSPLPCPRLSAQTLDIPGGLAVLHSMPHDPPQGTLPALAKREKKYTVPSADVSAHVPGQVTPHRQRSINFGTSLRGSLIQSVQSGSVQVHYSSCPAFPLFFSVWLIVRFNSGVIPGGRHVGVFFFIHTTPPMIETQLFLTFHRCRHWSRSHRSYYRDMSVLAPGQYRARMYSCPIPTSQILHFLQSRIPRSWEFLGTQMRILIFVAHRFSW